LYIFVYFVYKSLDIRNILVIFGIRDSFLISEINVSEYVGYPVYIFQASQILFGYLE